MHSQNKNGSVAEKQASIKVAVLGAGTWGTALALLYAGKGYEVVLWSALPEEVAEIGTARIHPKLPGVTIPDEICLTNDIGAVCDKANLLVFATPSAYIRATARSVSDKISHGQVIACVAKGIEPETLMTMTDVILDELSAAAPRVVCLSGPTHAEEVSMRMPSTIVSASSDIEASRYVQELTSCGFMRVYRNDDLKGVELCGAVKNVIALAAGISSGLGYGDNARAALVTRGLVEMRRLGVAMGCNSSTFEGLAGLGDLVVTCTSGHSRNNRAGCLMGMGLTAGQATREVGMVVEGLVALPSVIKLATLMSVEMPIVSAVDDIVNCRMQAADALDRLFSRVEIEE